MNYGDIITLYIVLAFFSPIFGALITAVIVGKSRVSTSVIAFVASLISFLTSAAVSLLLKKTGLEVNIETPWVISQITHLPSVFTVNLFSASLITIVSFIVCLSEIYLMNILKDKEDINWSKFYSLILLYHAVAIAALLSGSIIQLYIFTSIISVLEFMLCSAERKDYNSIKESRKLFILNIGSDILLLAAAITLTSFANTSNFSEIPENTVAGSLTSYYYSINCIILVFLSIACKAGFYPANLLLFRNTGESIPSLGLRLIVGHITIPLFTFIMVRPMLDIMPAIYLSSLLITVVLSTILVSVNSLCSEKISEIAGNICVACTGLLAIVIVSDTYIASLFLFYSQLTTGSLLMISATYINHLIHSSSIWDIGGRSHYIRVVIAVTAISALSVSVLPPLLGYWRNSSVLSLINNPFLEILIYIVIFILSLAAFRFAYILNINKSDDIVRHKTVSIPIAIVLGIFIAAAIVVNMIQIPQVAYFTGLYTPAEHSLGGGRHFIIAALITVCAGIVTAIFYKNGTKSQEIIFRKKIARILFFIKEEDSAKIL